MGGGISQSSTVNQVNDSVAQTCVDVATECSNGVASTQAISIRCQFNQALQDELNKNKAPYEENGACRACLDGVVQGKLAEYENQRSLWGAHSADIKKSRDQDIQEILVSSIRCGSSVCKACSLQNISQRSIIDSTQNCQAMNQIRNIMDQKLNAQIQQQLSNHQNAVSPLLEALGAKTKTSAISDLSSRIRSKITDTVVAQVRSEMTNFQTLSYTGAPTSVTGVSQDSAFTNVKNFFEKNKIFNDILSDEEWKTFQKVANEQKDPLSEAGEFVAKGTGWLRKSLNNTFGKVFIGIIAVTAAALIAIIVYVYVQRRKNLEGRGDTGDSGGSDDQEESDDQDNQAPSEEQNDNGSSWGFWNNKERHENYNFS